MPPKMDVEEGYITPRSCEGKRRGRHLLSWVSGLGFLVRGLGVFPRATQRKAQSTPKENSERSQNKVKSDSGRTIEEVVVAVVV